MAQALKSPPQFEVLDGELWQDQWTTPALALEVKPESRDRLLRLTITNPHFNTAYLRNTVKLTLDGEVVFSDLMFAGHGLRVERFVPAKAPVLLELSSEATLEADPLDDRSRGVWLKLEHREPAKE